MAEVAEEPRFHNLKITSRRRTSMKKLGLMAVMLMIASTVSFGKKADKTYTGRRVSTTLRHMIPEFTEV
jgi:hypothetical protein